MANLRSKVGEEVKDEAVAQKGNLRSRGIGGRNDHRDGSLLRLEPYPLFLTLIPLWGIVIVLVVGRAQQANPHY